MNRGSNPCRGANPPDSFSNRRVLVRQPGPSQTRLAERFGTLKSMSRIIRATSIGHSDAYQSIPVYSLVSAGGPFRDNPDARLLGRIHPPEKLKSLNPDTSLCSSRDTPWNPSSFLEATAYCVFFVPGSRSGRTVLVEERKIAECAYTLKRYVRRAPPRDEPHIAWSDLPGIDSSRPARYRTEGGPRKPRPTLRRHRRIRAGSETASGLGQAWT